MSNNNSTFNTFIAVAGLLGIGYGIAMYTKLSKISKRLDKSIDDLADDMEIDIPEELVKKAIDKSVDASAKNAADRAANEALGEIRRDIRNAVFTAVENEYQSIKDRVLAETTVAASKIDVAKVRRDVERAATKMATDKFEANLDPILQKFNDDLDNTAKIYSAIKGMMTPATTRAPGEVVLKIG